MIVKQYFTFRYLYIGKTVYNPQYDFNYNLPGLSSVEYKYVCGDTAKDGRHLAYVKFDLTEVQINVFEEMLQKFSYHAKTTEKALDFAKYITGISNLTMNNDNDIVFPQI